MKSTQHTNFYACDRIYLGPLSIRPLSNCFIYLLEALGKAILYMALTTLTSPSHYHHLSIAHLSPVGKVFVGRKEGYLIFESLNPEIISKNSALTREEIPRGDKLPRVTCQVQEIIPLLDQYIGGGDQADATRFSCERADQDKSCTILMTDIPFDEEKLILQENKHHKVYLKGIIHDMRTKENSSALVNDQGRSDSLETTKFGGVNGALKLQKRPAKLVLPAYSCPVMESAGEMSRRKLENKEFEVEGRNFVLASRKGRRMVMEDGYGAMLDILGDPKQVAS